MSTYVLMRILESAPSRYELGIRLLTLGRLDCAYDRLAARIEAGQRVLDIGCGTGALTLRSARRGAVVKGIDVNAQMLEIAAKRVREAGLEESVGLTESGVAELDSEQGGSYDAVTSGLCFSELNDAELVYTLRHVVRILRPGGLLLVADEVCPKTPIRRLLHALLRAPLVALTWILTQQTTRPVRDLPARLLAAGLEIVSLRSGLIGSFAELVARKPPDTAS
ncbi:MAG: corrinoid protein-associated methyltransferase CpaM [Planctomycetota bacterium]